MPNRDLKLQFIQVVNILALNSGAFIFLKYWFYFVNI